MDYKVYIFGDGHSYNELMSYLQYYPNIIVEAIVTTKPGIYSYIDGYRCISIDEAHWDEVDYCIVAIQNWMEVKATLCRVGMEDKIIRSHVFKIPGFNFDKYIKLFKSNISILSNYCLGGHLYREFGLKMLSPTINMYCSGMQYIRFLENYREYLGLEMKEVFADSHIDGTMGKEEFWPHGVIEDVSGNRITWVLNHDIIPGESVEKWNSRKKRVNFDNIVAIMIIQSDEEAYAFNSIKCEKKIGFYYKDLGLDSIICIREWFDRKNIIEFDSEFGTFVNTYMRNFVRDVPSVNWLSFLLGERDYIRKLY